MLKNFYRKIQKKSRYTLLKFLIYCYLLSLILLNVNLKFKTTNKIKI